ncbi:MAG TPA: hypothetical protein VNF29_01415 [Candidatus Binataceae bacterium]|nr:hypothetical protein [Candidatus Binataceae bacterium]
MATKKKYRFSSRGDVEKFWRAVRNVPARTRRSKRQEERYYLGLFLVALAGGESMPFSFAIEEINEYKSPDFMFHAEGERFGIEVTRATSPEFQRTKTALEKRHPEGYGLLLSIAGWANNGAAEQEWLRYVTDAILKKLPKLRNYQPAARHDLLIWEDAPLPAVNRAVVIPALAQWIRAQRPENPLLGKVSVVISLDVIYDVDGESRTLPFIDLESPVRFPDLGSRIEFAAQKAVRDELHRNGSR